MRAAGRRIDEHGVVAAAKAEREALERQHRKVVEDGGDLARVGVGLAHPLELHPIAGHDRERDQQPERVLCGGPAEVEVPVQRLRDVLRLGRHVTDVRAGRAGGRRVRPEAELVVRTGREPFARRRREGRPLG